MYCWQNSNSKFIFKFSNLFFSMNSTTQQKKNPATSNARFKKVKSKQVKKARVKMLQILIETPNNSKKTFEIKVITIYISTRYSKFETNITDGLKS